MAHLISMLPLGRSMFKEFKEAPVDWLLQTGCFGLDAKFADVLAAYFAVMALVMCSQWQFTAAASLLLSGFSFYTIPYGRKHFKGGWFKPSLVETTIAAMYTTFACMAVWTLYNVKDPVFRHRSMGISFILTKASVLMIGFRMVPALIIMCIIGLNDIIYTWAIVSKFQESNEVLYRLPCMILLMSSLYLVACYQQQGRWRMLYDTQVWLTAEKAAMESLLAMVCDSVLWLSADGNRVSRSSPQFDAIMGQAMLNVDFSNMIADNECRKFLNGEKAPSAAVALFPTSLVLSSSQTVKADLFIVDRRQSLNQLDKHKSDAMGFLVGLRLCEAFAIEPPVNERQDARPTSTVTSPVSPPSFKPHQDDDSRGTTASTKAWPNMTTFESRSDSILPLRKKMELLTASEGRNEMGEATLSQGEASDAKGVAFDKLLQVVEFNRGVTPSSRSSQSSVPRSILRKSQNTPAVSGSDAHKGPLHSSKFLVSGQYLTECSLSLLEDLVSSWNFDVGGCCAWHASLKHLEGMINKMKAFHQCREKWQASALWQCHNCTALSGPSHPEDACWICCEPSQSGENAANGTYSWQEGQVYEEKKHL